jgi:hypothetical protein
MSGVGGEAGLAVARSDFRVWTRTGHHRFLRLGRDKPLYRKHSVSGGFAGPQKKAPDDAGA